MGSRTRRAVTAVAVAAAGLAAVGACGIPTDDAPRLVADATSTSVAAPTSAPSADQSMEATLYFNGPDGGTGTDRPLVPVRRTLSGEPTPGRVLQALLDGPTEEEAAQGLVPQIPVGTTLLGQRLDEDGRLTVELSEEWATLVNPGAIRAYAQVVLTVTEDDVTETVRSVRFLVAGKVVDAPTDDESQSEVTRADYRSLDPG